MTAEGLFKGRRNGVYLWTVTFSALHSDWECGKLFRAFLNHLREVVGRTGWGGVRVCELHREHGVHYHLLVTERLAVDLVRRVGRCHGIGRIHVVRADEGSAAYLAKYLSKKGEGPRGQRGGSMRRWAAFGDVESTRCKDVVLESPMWAYRRQRGLRWRGYQQEWILSAAWDRGEDVFLSAWCSLGRAQTVGEAVEIASGRLRVRWLGDLTYKPERGPF